MISGCSAKAKDPPEMPVISCIQGDKLCFFNLYVPPCGFESHLPKSLPSERRSARKRQPAGTRLESWSRSPKRPPSGRRGDYGTRLNYSPASLRTGCQYATGILDLDGFESRSLQKRKTPPVKGGVFFSGGDYGTRTCDLMRVKHALYPADLSLHVGTSCIIP